MIELFQNTLLFPAITAILVGLSERFSHLHLTF